MNVPDGEKDANARTEPSGVLFFGNNDDAAIGGRHDCRWILWDNALWIAEEGKTEKSKGDKDCPQDPAVKYHGETA